MKKTSVTLLAALALGAFVPTLAAAQAARPAVHAAAKPVAQKKVAVKKAPAKVQKKVTCRYQMQKGKKIKVCK